MTCRLCIFLENGRVYGYFKRNTLEAKGDWNYGTAHWVMLIGDYTKEEVKKLHPNASFINFKDLGKHRLEREKIIEQEMSLNPFTIIFTPCESRRWLAQYYSRQDIIANGDTKQEAEENLKTLYKSVYEFEADEKSGKDKINFLSHD